MKPKSFYLLDNIMVNLKFTINKYIRSMLTFNLSVNVAIVVLASVYLKTLFLIATMPVELKSNMEHPLDKIMYK